MTTATTSGLDVVTLVGSPVSPGAASGPARVALRPDAADVLSGEVLVVPCLGTGWLPLLERAAGVVSETGGLLSDLAIIARENGIPVVGGVPAATQVIRDGATISVDGTLGLIHVVA